MSNKAVAYCRVSTTDQSTSIQKDDLKAYAKARGWELLKVYEDKLTGTNSNRPDLKKLMADARQRKFDIIVCWKLDRFFRSLRDIVNTLHELEQLGIQFVSFKDNIDLTTSSGRLMVHLIAAFAEFEASLIKERVTAGVRRKISKTGSWGRKSNRDDQKISELKLKGLSNRVIAKRLNISEATVRRSLKSASSPSKNRGSK